MEVLWKELLTSRLAVQYTTHLTLSDDQGQGLSARQEPLANPTSGDEHQCVVTGSISGFNALRC
jgi:hypothetical protein